MIPSPGVQDQKGYPVLEFRHEKQEHVGRHISVYPTLVRPPPGCSGTYYASRIWQKSIHTIVNARAVLKRTSTTLA